jgi:deoxyribodipyrimidine photolyase-related protein
VLDDMRRWEIDFGLPVEIREDNRFLCSRAEFARWAGGQRTYRMEFFYREMRRRTGLLMDGDAPEQGRWNFDAENRKPLPASHQPPPPLRFAPDAITREVLALVGERFEGHFGTLEPFGWAVDREGALLALSSSWSTACRITATTRTRCGQGRISSTTPCFRPTSMPGC